MSSVEAVNPPGKRIVRAVLEDWTVGSDSERRAWAHLYHETEARRIERELERLEEEILRYRYAHQAVSGMMVTRRSLTDTGHVDTN